MKKLFILFFSSLLFLANSNLLAADLEFDSFAEAEAAAKKRAEEYKKKMNEHLEKIKKDWEQQQKDLGESGNTPDITDITFSSSGTKTSDTEAQKKLEEAVNSSVNKMKDMMIQSATPNSIGFAGGGAGYQYEIKFVNGKYILSDSYNEAAFNTGYKNNNKPKSAPAESEKVATSKDDKEDMVVADKPENKPDDHTTETAAPSAPSSVNTPNTLPDESAVSRKPVNDTGSPSGTPAAPTAPDSTGNKPMPGIDLAPTKLPEPDVRMVIQHPTDFTEDVFSTNTNNEAPVEYSLNKFKIPEDTRVKIALEISKDVDPSKIALVMTDEEGSHPPINSNKMKNYRHLFRVPSDDKYSATVIFKEGNNTKELMKVTIPVIKVDFNTRTIDDQRRKIGSEGLINSSTTSHSTSEGNFRHSTFGTPQQVDLSDMYSDPYISNSNNFNNQADSFTRQSSKNESADSYSSYDNYSSSDTDLENILGNNSDSDSTGNSSSSLSSNRSSGNYVSADGSSANYQGNGSGISNEANSYNSTQKDESSNHSFLGSAENATEESNKYAKAIGINHSGSSWEEYESISSNQQDENETDSYSDLGSSYYRSDSSFADYSDPSNNKIDNSIENAQNTVSKREEDEDPFVMALSMQAVSHKIFQSFDFIDDKNPVSAEIPAGTEVTFSMTFSSKVDPSSVCIELDDGNGKVTGDLKTWGVAFAYVFNKPAMAHFIVSGTAETTPFTYRLNIPVK